MNIFTRNMNFVKFNNQDMEWVKFNGVTVYEAWKRLTVSGVPPITLTKCKGVDLVEYKIYGKSTQETRSGKNLFDKFKDFNYGNTNYKTSLNNKGQIVSTSNYYVKRSAGILIENLQPNTDYTISGVLVSANGTYKNNANIDIRGVSGTAHDALKVVSFASTLTKPYSFEKTFNTGEYTSIWVSFNGHNADTTATTETIFDNIQIEQGQIKTEYEPYRASPSPDYPSEIESVEGYNSFSKSLFDPTLWNITGTEEEFSIQAKNTGTTNQNIPLELAGYCFEGIIEYKNMNGSITLKDGDNTRATILAVFDSSSNSVEQNIVSANANDKLRIIVYQNTSIITFKKCQLVKGTTPKTYLPHKHIGIKVTGKNLFDVNDFESQLVSGKILNDRGVEISDSGSRYSKYKIFLKANTTYYLKGAWQRIYYYDENDNFKSRHVQVSGIDKAYTPTENEYIRFQINDVYWRDNKGMEQVEVGAITTDYEQYKENITIIPLDEPLRSLPNGVKDIAYIKNNRLYVDRYVGSVVLDGSENWYLSSSNETRSVFYSVFSGKIKPYTNGKEIPALRCSHFNPVAQNSTWKSGEISREPNTNNIFLIMPNGYTIDSFKTWLSTHNTQVDYELDKPYTEEFDEPYNILTFKGTTILSVNTNIQPSNVEVTYIGKQVR